MDCMRCGACEGCREEEEQWTRREELRREIAWQLEADEDADLAHTMKQTLRAVLELWNAMGGEA